MQPGDRVAIMLEPSRAFYAAVFGTMKIGAIAVPLFTLFGPDGVKLRVDDCKPSLLVTNAEKAPLAGVGRSARRRGRCRLPRRAWRASSRISLPTRRPIRSPSSSTRRARPASLPEAVKHSHRSIVTLMVAALYGTGLRPGDRFICPSSPAWGHGLWHGTLAPLALGVTVGAYAGKFDAERLLSALQEHQFTNISAAATHYRMMSNSGAAGRYRYGIQKLSFTGEPIDSETADFVEQTFRRAGLQHVRHDRDRRDPGELSGCARLRRQAGLAGQADSRRQHRGPDAGRDSLVRRASSAS